MEVASNPLMLAMSILKELWILTDQWILDSATQGKWLVESQYGKKGQLPFDTIWIDKRISFSKEVKLLVDELQHECNDEAPSQSACVISYSVPPKNTFYCKPADFARYLISCFGGLSK